MEVLHLNVDKEFFSRLSYQFFSQLSLWLLFHTCVKPRSRRAASHCVAARHIAAFSPVDRFQSRFPRACMYTYTCMQSHCIRALIETTGISASPHFPRTSRDPGSLVLSFPPFLVLSGVAGDSCPLLPSNIRPSSSAVPRLLPVRTQQPFGKADGLVGPARSFTYPRALPRAAVAFRLFFGKRRCFSAQYIHVVLSGDERSLISSSARVHASRRTRYAVFPFAINASGINW